MTHPILDSSSSKKPRPWSLGSGRGDAERDAPSIVELSRYVEPSLLPTQLVKEYRTRKKGTPYGGGGWERGRHASDCFSPQRGSLKARLGRTLINHTQKRTTVGTQNGTAWSFLKRLKTELPYDPATLLLGIHTKELKKRSRRDSCALMIIATVFTLAKRQRQPKCLLMGR